MNEILTPKAAAALLAVGRSTLARLIEQQGLPYLDFGPGPGGKKTGEAHRMIRFRRADLERWLSERSVVPQVSQHHPWEKHQRRAQGAQP